MLRVLLLFVYLAALGMPYAADTVKRGSGLDPLGLTSESSPPPPETERGSGLDPLG